MAIDCKRIWRGLFVISALMLASLASAATPTVGAPQLGSAARAAKPVILTSDALNPQSYKVGFADGLLSAGITELMSAASDTKYAEKVARTAVAVRRSAPTLNVEESMREALKCGAAESLCTELVALGELAPTQSADEAIAAVLEAHQWTEARVLAIWWDRGGGLNTHGSLRAVSLDDKAKLTFDYPILFGYAIPVAEDADDPNAEAWGSDPTIPKEATIRESLAQLEPLAQLVLSWNANNDEKLYREHIHALPMLRKVRKQGLECKGMNHCNEEVEGIVGTRLWTWRFLRYPPIGSGPPVFELMSRPLLPTK
jgi:hypothetical protein